MECYMKKVFLTLIMVTILIGFVSGCKKANHENSCCECKDCPECDVCCDCDNPYLNK